MNLNNKMLHTEKIEHNGIEYAQIIWADSAVETTTFISPAESSFQFGLLAHTAGFVEEPHYHASFARTITDLQQMFVVQKGEVEVVLFDDNKEFLRSISLKVGDAIVLIHGIHQFKATADMQCISVKQGPFLGTDKDKVVVEVKPKQ